jgi:hypothetical protein
VVPATATAATGSPGNPEVEVELVEGESEGDIKTYAGQGKKAELKLMGKFEKSDGTLTISDAHIQGGGPGTSSLSELRSFIRGIGRSEGVGQVIVRGAERTSGANAYSGHRPPEITVQVK